MLDRLATELGTTASRCQLSAGNGAWERQEGLSSSPPVRLIYSGAESLNDSRSCSINRLCNEGFLQHITNQTITHTYRFNAACSQLAPQFDAISGCALSKSRGAHACDTPRHCTLLVPGGVGAVVAVFTQARDATVSPVVTHTYACVDAAELTPLAASQRQAGGTTPGATPLSSPKAPTREIFTDPSLPTHVAK